MTKIPELPAGIVPFTPYKLIDDAILSDESINNVIVPVSGGKDSLACLLKALDTDKTVTAVFNDTGWDHPETYEYLRYLEHTLKITIHTTTGANRKDGAPAGTLIELIRAQKRFPFGQGRFCTKHLKQRALKRWYIDTLYDGVTKFEVWFGMRQEEGVNRAIKYAEITDQDVFTMNDVFPGMYSKSHNATLFVRLPVVDWSEQQVFNFADKRKIKRNPLYNEGTNNRVGCYPCMLSSKKVQQKIFATNEGKKRLIMIRQLEKELGVKYEMFDTENNICEVCKI